MDKGYYDKMMAAMDRIKEVDVAGIKLEEFDERLLYVDQLDINVQLAIQPSAYAYYNSLLNDAEAELKSVKEEYDRWFKCKMSEASAQLMGSNPDAYKPTESDKKARVYINCKQESLASEGKNEIDTWEDRIRELEKYRNLLKFWCDALTTKNFILPHYINRMNIEGTSISSYKGGHELTPIERPLSNLKKSNLRSDFSRNS